MPELQPSCRDALEKIGIFFAGRAPVEPDFTATVEQRGLETEDDPDPQLEDDAVGHEYWASGTVVGIDYVDSRRNQTRRWVSLTRLRKSNDDKIYVVAWCFMREQIRNFRLDRIENVFTEDGELLEKQNVFGLDVEFELPQQRPADAFRGVAGSGIRALMALARIDGHLHDSEVDEIIGYAQDEMAYANEPYSQQDVAELEVWIKKLQPAGAVVKQDITKILSWNATRQRDWLRYAKRVANADRCLHESEVAMLIDIQQSMAEC